MLSPWTVGTLAAGNAGWRTFKSASMQSAHVNCRAWPFGARLFAAISAVPILCTHTVLFQFTRAVVGCQHRVPYRIVMQLLGKASPDLLQKYERAILNSYIEDNANVRWCSSVPCCGRAIEALDDGYCEPKCECGHSFCFKCGSQPHSPATCGMWQQWEVKMCDDSETKNYLKVPPPTVAARVLQGVSSCIPDNAAFVCKFCVLTCVWSLKGPMEFCLCNSATASSRSGLREHWCVFAVCQGDQDYSDFLTTWCGCRPTANHVRSAAYQWRKMGDAIL